MVEVQHQSLSACAQYHGHDEDMVAGFKLLKGLEGSLEDIGYDRRGPGEADQHQEEREIGTVLRGDLKKAVALARHRQSQTDQQNRKTRKVGERRIDHFINAVEIAGYAEPRNEVHNRGPEPEVEQKY